MSKGSAAAAAKATGQATDFANQYNADASGIQSTELPFLQNELTNPQGFGQQTVNQMTTQGGQAVSGATGAADEQARLAASRTGNPAALSGVVDNTARNAMRQQSNNVLGIDTENAQAKLQQQQQGSSGLESMYGTDVNAALKALGIVPEDINAWTAGRKAVNEADQNIFQDVNKVGTEAYNIANGNSPGYTGGGGG